MSLAKLGKFSKFFEKQLLKCSNRGLYAFISYRDNSKSAEPPYKYVKSKIRVEGSNIYHFDMPKSLHQTQKLQHKNYKKFL